MYYPLCRWCFFFFFFSSRRRHTMFSRDWSSDVCSSDLGDPIDVMMAESVDASVKANLRAELGLDRPIYVQYAAWMGRLLRGDLGRSIRNGEPVLENVSRRLRPSLELAFLAMTISLVVAFPVG